MIDLEEQAAWVRETRRSAFWRGVIVGAAAMLLLTTCVGCSTPRRTAALVGFVAVSVAISADHGKHAPQQFEVKPGPGLPCHPQPDGSCR